MVVRQRDGTTTMKPKLGLLCVTSGWFRDIGLQGSASDSTAAVERTAQDLVARLSADVELVYRGVLFSAADASRAAREMRDAGVDGVVLVPLMWCEEAIPRAALEILAGLPIMLWVFSPRADLPGSISFQSMLQGSGAVCALQLSGMLKREGRAVVTVAGHADDPSVYETIAIAARGMGIARALRTMRVGVLPFPCDQMSTTWVDEFGLRSRYGIALRYLELERVRVIARAATAAEIAGMGGLLAEHNVDVRVDGGNLEEGIRYSLALEKILADEGLATLAMNDVISEMHGSFGLRPCLWNPRLSAAGTVISMEADVPAAVAMRILRMATGAAPFYCETLGADWRADLLLLGHAGYHDATAADPAWPVTVIPDVEYENSDRWTGAATYFKYRPGPTTIVNCVWDGAALKWMAAEGESLVGPPRLEGNSHLVFKPDIPIPEFFRRAVADGVSQHWLAVPGRRSRELELLAGILGIRWTPLPHRSATAD